ncbi:hypothetical protein CFP56_041039 [Quercus suber]|uniref:Uncharacterized protein n=1 Tax=Quercus suber TaxID=58331 RepID=A0AAW0LLH9_QUESU
MEGGYLTKNPMLYMEMLSP